jgi:hypothetical protein
MPALAGLHMGMRAAKVRYLRMNDQRVAASFPHYDLRYQRQLISEYGVMIVGPGPIEKWEDRLTEAEKKEIKACNDELDLFYAQLAEQGMLRGADGSAPLGELFAKPEPLRGDTDLDRLFAAKPGDKVQ